MLQRVASIVEVDEGVSKSVRTETITK